MNVIDHGHFSTGVKNFAAGFHNQSLKTYTGRQVVFGGKVWGSMQWATAANSGDGPDDQDALMGLCVTWGSPPPAPTSRTPASGKLFATIDLMSGAEGTYPLFNGTLVAIGARQDTPFPSYGRNTLVTPDGLDVTVWMVWDFTLTFGLGVYRGMSAWTEAVWNSVDW